MSFDFSSLFSSSGSFDISKLFSLFGGGGPGGGLGGGLGGGVSLLGGGPGGVGGGDYMSGMRGEAQEGIQNSLEIANLSKELSMAQALGKFMKANGEACKSMAP